MGGLLSAQRVLPWLVCGAVLAGSVSVAAAGQDVPGPPAIRVATEQASAWRLAAAGRYQAGDFMGALAAWNRAGEPRIDLTDVHGANHTREAVVLRAAGLRPGRILTPDAFARALRRLRDVPVISTADLNYDAAADGSARMDIAIEERHVVPSGWVGLGTVTARAVILNELKIDVAGSMGDGELATAAWRWSARRPRVALSLAMPSPIWFRGVVSLDGSWERQSYDATPAAAGATVLREERRRLGLRVGDWWSGRLHWQAGAAIDRLGQYAGVAGSVPARNHLAVESALDARLADDRIALIVSGGSWTPFGGGDRFGTAGVLAAWRSTVLATSSSWSALTGLDVTSRVAPLALWPGAGTGEGRPGLLRAHPLLSDSILKGAVFGRTLARASVEYARPVGNLPAGGLAIAGFVDSARAWHRVNGLPASPLYVDAGAGIRLRAPGPGGAIRVDLAHGLRGGGTTLSASWGGAWPR